MRRQFGNAIAIATICAGVVACAQQPVEVGRAFYGENCASCHGADGRGGPLAATLTRAPVDLTTIAARNGGVFDRNQVMSTIDGYFRRDDTGHPMPEFGAIMEGRVVMIEGADGTVTPTPEVLLGLADYLEGLQR